jgi:hypothetical protein
VRYTDEIQCAAGRIVHALRSHARSRSDTGNGDFHSLHVRRGDFSVQYEDNSSDARYIYNATQDVIPEGSVVYISTDESNKTYFNPLRDHYDIKFLDDFVQDLNTPQSTVDVNFYGMIDQLVVRLDVMLHSNSTVNFCFQKAYFSLFMCLFFNLMIQTIGISR